MNGSLISGASIKGIPLIESFSAAMKPKAGKPDYESAYRQLTANPA